MSDPKPFEAPERFRGGAVDNAASVADRCPGAILNGNRVDCTGTVLMTRRGNTIYRSALCAACSAREAGERKAARESHDPIASQKKSRRAAADK